MNKHPMLLVGSLTVAALFTLGACTTSVDRVVKAIPSTTTAATTDAPTTTPASTTVPDTRSADAETYVNALTESMTADAEFPLDDVQARCVAEKVVDIVGADRLRNEGVLPENIGDSDSLDFSTFGLSMDEGNAIYDSFADCKIDFRETFMESLAQDGDITPEAKTCFDTVLTDENLRKLMVTSLVRGDDAVENDEALKPLMSGMMGCMFMTMGSDDSTP